MERRADIDPGCVPLSTRYFLVSDMFDDLSSIFQRIPNDEDILADEASCLEPYLPGTASEIKSFVKEANGPWGHDAGWALVVYG